MLDIGWPELLVIAIVLIVVVGPKDLPGVLRGFGRTTAKMRAMAGDFRRQFDEALREAELDDVKSLADDVRKLDPRNEIKKHLSPLQEAGRDIAKGLDEAGKPMAEGDGKAPSEVIPATATQPVTTEAPQPANVAAKPSASNTRTKAVAPKKAASSKPAKPAAEAKPAAAARKKTTTAARGKKNAGSTS